MTKPGDLENSFSYHQANKETAPKHDAVRSECLELAVELDGLLPDGREKSLVMTKLEEVMFWANAAIARSG